MWAKGSYPVFWLPEVMTDGVLVLFDGVAVQRCSVVTDRDCRSSPARNCVTR